MLDQPERLDPEQTFADPDAKAMAAAITLTAQLSNTRNLVIQTYVPRDAAVAEYHGLLDKLSKAMNRQEAVLDLETEELNLKVEQDKLRDLKEDFLRIEEIAQIEWDARGKKGAFKLGPKEDAARRTAMTNVDRYTTAIAERKLRIDKLKAKIANME